MNSMTAFAKEEYSTDQLTVQVEIRSYNSRFLDVVLRLPQHYLALEDRIKKIIAAELSRGRIEYKLKVASSAESAHRYEINANKAYAYHQALLALQELLALPSGPSLDLVAGASGIIEPSEEQPDLESGWQAIRHCSAMALKQLTDMRYKEGAFIAQDFVARLTAIEEMIDRIDAESKDMLQHYQQRLTERIGLLTQGIAEVDQARLWQEAALLADRSDIAEELVRSRSHIKQFRAIMNGEEPAGRKLNFLLQEINREFNTMGAKAEKVTVSHLVVELKSELEKIREQVQNVE